MGAGLRGLRGQIRGQGPNDGYTSGWCVEYGRRRPNSFCVRVASGKDGPWAAGRLHTWCPRGDCDRGGDVQPRSGRSDLAVCGLGPCVICTHGACQSRLARGMPRRPGPADPGGRWSTIHDQASAHGPHGTHQHRGEHSPTRVQTTPHRTRRGWDVGVLSSGGACGLGDCWGGGRPATPTGPSGECASRYLYGGPRIRLPPRSRSTHTNNREPDLARNQDIAEHTPVVAIGIAACGSLAPFIIFFTWRTFS
jgi:hypothetical protein